MGDLQLFIKPSYMPIRSSHINMNFRLSRALSPILLSKMTDFSPKNITFFAVKTFWAVPDTLQCYQLDPRTSADPGGCLTQKFGVDLWMGSEPLCRTRILSLGCLIFVILKLYCIWFWAFVKKKYNYAFLEHCCSKLHWAKNLMLLLLNGWLFQRNLSNP